MLGPSSRIDRMISRLLAPEFGNELKMRSRSSTEGSRAFIHDRGQARLGQLTQSIALF
jgi:hypothetical protein